jgi:serine/threonine protein phosphatase PrpC
MYIQSQGATHIGRRQNNEDSLAVNDDLGLYLVADGMGGYEGGEVASRIVAETVEQFLSDYSGDREMTWPFALDKSLDIDGNLIKTAIHLAHRRVLARRHGPLAQMGSTVALLALRQDRAIIGHVGDSRVYRLRRGLLEQLTRDHSLLEELRDNPDHPFGPEARQRFAHVITRALGIPPSGNARQPEPDLRQEPLEEGDIFLLCTDGLLEAVPEAQIARTLAQHTPANAARWLVQEAYNEGGKDNITVVVLEYLGQPTSGPARGEQRDALEG